MSVGKLYSMDPAVTTRVVALRLQHFSVTFADATAHYTHTSQRSSDDGPKLVVRQAYLHITRTPPSAQAMMAKACCAASLPSLQLSSRSRDATDVTDVTEMSHRTTQVVKGGPPKGPDDIFERARQAGAEDGGLPGGPAATNILPVTARQAPFPPSVLNDMPARALCPFAGKRFCVGPKNKRNLPMHADSASEQQPLRGIQRQSAHAGERGIA